MVQQSAMGAAARVTFCPERGCRLLRVLQHPSDTGIMRGLLMLQAVSARHGLTRSALEWGHGDCQHKRAST
eukprot:5599395-Pyramimonas_sp.AAC.1